MTKYNNCPICDFPIEHLESQSDISTFKTSSGVKVLNVEGLSYSKCSSCGEVFYNADELDLRDQKIKEALDKKRISKGLLTSDQVKEIRVGLGMSQAALEKILGLGAKSFARWETNKADQSKSADLLLRAIKKGGKKFLLSIVSEQNAEKHFKHKKLKSA